MCKRDTDTAGLNAVEAISRATEENQQPHRRPSQGWENPGNRRSNKTITPRVKRCLLNNT